MAQPAPPPSDPPPPDTWRERCRDWRRSVSRLNRPQHWLLTRFLRWGSCFLALYVGGGLLLGWTTAYNVLLGITSPADTEFPWYGVPLSLTGWLLVPAVVGGASGYLVNRQIERRRRVPEADLLEQMRAQASTPPAPRSGSGG
ncbi:DUF6313 family protein [Streptomyces sp. NPDC046727]|uniref:DUF6313 family protein n=1 Tax=Streptomyces sp. NPDC046727 TaxID=3155373 RepID=UPI0033F5EFCD